MPTIEPFYQLIGVKQKDFKNKENYLLEAELFVRICEELTEFFREQYREYFCLMKFTREKENAVLETKFLRLIIQDILLTDDYNLQGIAQYANVPEEVVEEVATGRNTNPSAILLRRVINLHRSVRRDLYNAIIRKITRQYAFAADDTQSHYVVEKKQSVDVQAIVDSLLEKDFHPIADLID